MDVEILRSFFGWCAVVNISVLLYWFLMLAFAKKWVLSLHRKWFDITEQQFDVIHYSGMGLLKCISSD